MPSGCVWYSGRNRLWDSGRPLTHAFRRGASAQRVWTRALLFFPSPAALAGHRLQAACWSGLGKEVGAGGSGIRPPARHPCQAQRRCCLSVPSGSGIGQPGEERAHVRPALGSIDSIPLTTLAGSPARGGKCALRETPRPDKRAFVRAGGENVWVLGFLGSGACSLPIPKRWANIARIKRRAACPAGPAGAGGCWTPRLLCLPPSAWSSWERRDLVPDGRGGCVLRKTPGNLPSLLEYPVGLWSTRFLC